MMQCSCVCISTNKVKTFGDYVVSGFNKYTKQLRTKERPSFQAWQSFGNPRAGSCFTNLCQSRLRIKGF